MSAIHPKMLCTAKRYLPGLHRAMKRVGPQEMGSPSRLGVALYLSRSVVGQQLSGKAAGTIWARVQQQCRSQRLGLGALVRRDGVAWLRQCGLSGSKARAIGAIHEAEDEGLFNRRRLAGMGHGERSAVLTQIWGVGQWTCDMLSMFYFLEPDIWPRADSAANKVLAEFMARDGVGGHPWQAAELFRPHRSYLALYSWRIADAGLA